MHALCRCNAPVVACGRWGNARDKPICKRCANSAPTTICIPPPTHPSRLTWNSSMDVSHFLRDNRSRCNYIGNDLSSASGRVGSEYICRHTTNADIPWLGSERLHLNQREAEVWKDKTLVFAEALQYYDSGHQKGLRRRAERRDLSTAHATCNSTS